MKEHAEKENQEMKRVTVGIETSLRKDIKKV